MQQSRPGPRRLIAKFYRSPDGTQPVDDYIDRQGPAVQLAIDRQIERINLLDESNPHLAFPNSSQIDGDLRELRCHYGRKLYRILYKRSEQFVVLLHIFEKHDAHVSEEDKQIAQQRWADFRARLNARPRTPPSPIGRKASTNRRP
ncbi:MAG: type II toxin-antitoxin system RelE/ParE family toxin [Vulcanimicrobiaceae bacterium]